MKLDKAMDIARKREATVNDNKAHLYVIAKPTLMLLNKIPIPSVESVGLTMEKMPSPRHKMQEMQSVEPLGTGLQK